MKGNSPRINPPRSGLVQCRVELAARLFAQLRLNAGLGLLSITATPKIFEMETDYLIDLKLATCFEWVAFGFPDSSNE